MTVNGMGHMTIDPEIQENPPVPNIRLRDKAGAVWTLTAAQFVFNDTTRRPQYAGAVGADGREFRGNYSDLRLIK